MVGTVCNAPEIRPNLDRSDPESRAKAHDQRIRDLDQFVRGVWAELGYLCLLVRNGEEWKLLGFHSFDAWLLEAAPCSRASCYGGMKAFEELAEDFTPAEMVDIPHGNAHVLKLLPKSARANPTIREAAKKQRPKQFRETVIKEYPDAHIEAQVKKVFVFEESQWLVIERALTAYREIEDMPNLSDAEAIEGVCAQWRHSQ